MTDVWHPTTEAWEAARDDRERLRALLAWAVLAPSSHNTQPWIFRLADDHAELFADRTRALPVADPDDREMTVSCGAALFNLRLAAARLGREPLVEICPDPGEPDLLARIRLGPSHEPSDAERAMFDAIPHRHTHRGAFESRPLPHELLEELVTAAEREGAWLAPLTADDRRASLADLVAEGDRLQMADTRFRRELASWLHPTRTRQDDGMPAYAFELRGLAGAFSPLVVRLFDMGEGQARRDRALAEGSPAMAVVGCASDTAPALLAAGQALEHVLLLARTWGVHASYLNQPVQVPELRVRLADLARRPGLPQVVLRLGYADEARPTPRRPPEAVTVT